jgi:putative tryptophan/tyrosine transport system substrate-binding protein
MNRREVLAGLALPLLARDAWAQRSNRTRRIGALMGIADDAEGRARVTAFEQALKQLGWENHRNILIDYRWAGGAVDMQSYARALVDAAPDLLLATSTTTATALQQQTQTIPIVFVQVSDPLWSGLAASLAHPGANLTGFSSFDFSMAGKWVEILKEMDPRLSRVVVIFNQTTAPFAKGYVGFIEEAGRALSIGVSTIQVQEAVDLDATVTEIVRTPKVGLVVLPDIFMTTHRERIAALASEHRLPAIYPFKVFVTAGGLVSYGADQLDSFSRAASYVDRILKGASPSDLPIQHPTKFQLIINLKTAKTVGLTIPPALIARADEVIE